MVADSRREALDALRSDSPINRDDVRRWIKGDLETRAITYRLTNVGWSRIEPELSMDEQCEFMGTYLVDCIEQNVQDEDDIHSGFEAAWEFAAWLKHLQKIEGTEEVIRAACAKLENLYRRSDKGTRERIQTGAVEHILEEKKLRKYFEHWSQDPVLRKTYELALQWGKAHES